MNKIFNRLFFKIGTIIIPPVIKGRQLRILLAEDNLANQLVAVSPDALYRAIDVFLSLDADLPSTGEPSPAPPADLEEALIAVGGDRELL